MGLWRVLSDLEEDGYRTEWGLFSAEETGAPHQRIRVFILAHRGGFGSTPGISEQIEGQEGQSEEFNHDSGGQLVNPASEGLEGCARESVQGRSEGSARTDREAQLGDPKHDGLYGDSFSGGSGEDRERSEEGKEASEQSTGASGQEDLRYLQGAELAHTASREPRQSQARNGGQDIGGGSEEELGNSTKQGSQDCGEQREVGSESEATSGERCESSPPFEHAMSAHHGGATQWPARPGEEQYEWEEPRVVVDRSIKRCGGRKNKNGKDGEGISEQKGEERSILRSKTEGCSGDGETANDEAQSELGGAVDGLTHRVDRLRLLGNGVVPQTAELAWKTLWRKMNEDND